MRAVLVLVCVAGCATAEPTGPSLDASAKADAFVSAPAIVAGQGGACRANITLTWSLVPGASYDVEWGLANPQGMHSLSFAAGTTSAQLTNVGPGNYSWRVRALIDSTPSTWSSSAFVVTPGAAGEFDAKPADFKANVNSQTIATPRGVILDGPNIGSGTEGVFVAATNTTLMGGAHDFTSFTIAKGATVTVVGGPLFLAVTGAIDIEGTLDASGARGGDGAGSTFGKGGAGVAGGADGGDGVSSGNPAPGHDGVGLGKGLAGVTWQGGGGGGFASMGGTSASSTFGAGVAGGVAYGTIDLAPLYAGSGGGGGSGSTSCGSGGGGAGGGALKLTAGQSLTIGALGVVRANGGDGGSGGGCGGGGGGSGGTIWLLSRTLTNDGLVTTNGGAAGPSALTKGGAGSVGRLRFDGLLTGTGTTFPMVGYAGDFSYAPFGTSTSPPIAPMNLCGWGTLRFDVTTFPGTSVQVDVVDANDKVLVADAPQFMKLSSIDASSIKLRAALRTNDVAVTPALSGWSVGYTAP